MKTRARASLLAIAVLALAATGCQTTPEPETGPLPPITGEGFQPASPVAPLRLEDGRYPNLYAPNSFAVWVSEGVAAAKLQRDQQAGLTISPMLAADAEYIAANYYVIELHLESVFPDSSIAYDVVGLRNMNVYLALPDGRRTVPLQRVLGTRAREEQQGALKQFGRTNVVVFPKQEVLLGEAVVPAGAGAVRLVIEGFNTTFSFAWAAAPQPQAVPIAEAGPMTFSGLYEKVRVLAHKFQ